jgi:succinoglycan biosynthesis protein ExoM
MLPHITVCICTYRRPTMLQRLLREIPQQETGGCFTYSIVVADNDVAQSARTVVEKCRTESNIPIVYTVEPERNIALARNAAVSHATGELIASIDDDESPAPEWLLNLFRACEAQQVAGVLGPIKPRFENGAPRWVVKGGFYERPVHYSGYIMPWHECRTGNLLFRREILDRSEPVFRREFGSGGEDQDFFQRMIQCNHRFIWCAEAVVFEFVPPARWSRRFIIHRALLRGKNTFRHPKDRFRNLLKSVIAIPAYAFALPVLLLASHHQFMKYVVKLADHVGRILASIGLNPVSERRM